MRYFKALITYEIIPPKDNATQFEQTLYCCAPNHFATTKELRDIFYSLYGKESHKKYLSDAWKEVREEEIPGEAGINLF